MEAIIKSATTTTYQTSTDSDYILNFFNIPKLKTTISNNHHNNNNQLLGQTSPSLSGISESSNENFDGGGNINSNNNNNNNQKNIQINSNSSNSSDIDDPVEDDDSEQELTNLTWLTELRNQSLTWPESIKPIFDYDDDDDDDDNENDYLDDNDNDSNNNRDKNTLINQLTGNTANSLTKLKMNRGQNKLNNNALNNCTINNHVIVKKQTASERFNKFLDQIKKTRNDYDFSASTYQMDTNEKPPFNYSQIIGMAMLENGRMTLQQICTWIEEKFAYYRIRKNWNNSIRHNLSLQFCFRKIDRKKYEKGKGGYWELAMDIAKSERKRIRNRKTKKFINNENGNRIINHQNTKNYYQQQRAPSQRFQNNRQQNQPASSVIALSQIIENVLNGDNNGSVNNIQPTTENIILTIKGNNNIINNNETMENNFNEISNNNENFNDLNLTESTFNELITKPNHIKHQNNLNIENNDNNNYQNYRHKNQTIQMEINLDGELVPINNNNNNNTNEICSQNIIKIKINNDKLKNININNNNNNIEKINNSNIQLEDIFMVANNNNKINNNITNNNNNNYNKTINNNNINLSCDTEQIMNYLNETDTLNEICHKNDNHSSITLSSSKEQQQQHHHHHQQQEEIFEDEFQPGTIVDPTTMEIQQQLQQQIFITSNNAIDTTSQEHETSAENIVVSSFLNDNSPIIGPNVIVQQLPYYTTIPVMDVITNTTRTITHTNCFSCSGPNSNSNLCRNNCSQQQYQNNNNNNNCITTIDNDIDNDNITDDIIENQFRPYIDGIDEAFQFLRNSEHRSDELLDGLYDISVGDF